MAKILRRYESTIYGNYRSYYCRWGVVIGFLLWVVLMGEWFLFADKGTFSPNSMFVELALAVFVFVAVRRYRKQLPEEKVTLKELMYVGLGASVVAAVIYGLIIWLTAGVIIPDWNNAFIDGRIAVMDPADVSADAKIAVEKVRLYSAGDWGFIGGFRIAVWSVLVSFIAALVFRTEKAPVKSKSPKN